MEKKKKKSNKGKKPAKSFAKKKASFKHKGGKKVLKSKTKGKRAGEPAPERTVYHIYDLSPLPCEAWPQWDKPNRGLHSYTLNFGGAVVEVLLGKEAYFIKKVLEGYPGPCNQVTWGRHGGPVSAWHVAKTRSGFSRDE